LIVIFIGCAANLGLPAFRAAFLLQCLFYSFVLLSMVLPVHRYCKLLGIPLFFCTLNAAALVSILQVLRGQRFTTWETVR
jgi:hypothetical protein